MQLGELMAGHGHDEGAIMRLEPRPARSAAASVLWPAGAILATVVFSSLLVMIAGASP
jgi:hypothetical protein